MVLVENLNKSSITVRLPKFSSTITNSCIICTIVNYTCRRSYSTTGKIRIEPNRKRNEGREIKEEERQKELQSVCWRESEEGGSERGREGGREGGSEGMREEGEGRERRE